MPQTSTSSPSDSKMGPHLKKLGAMTVMETPGVTEKAKEELRVSLDPATRAETQ